MVYVMWSFRVAPGKDKEAEDWIRRFYAYIEKEYGLKSIAMRPLTPGEGEQDRISGCTMYDSLSAWAEHMERVPRDAERNAFLREVGEKQIFAPGGYTRTLCTPVYPPAGT
jgi:hypothetical protein